jgi:hypothetical protein
MVVSAVRKSDILLSALEDVHELTFVQIVHTMVNIVWIHEDS